MSTRKLTIFTIINITLAALNIGLFVAWKVWDQKYQSSDLSTNITILQAMVTAAIIILAAMNFIGFGRVLKEAKSSAVDIANKEAVKLEGRIDEKINERFNELNIEEGRKSSGVRDDKIDTGKSEREERDDAGSNEKEGE